MLAEKSLAKWSDEASRNLLLFAEHPSYQQF